jgi:streptogramin lyase
MKTKRELSGIYFRSQNPETGKWDNVVFEDLTEEEQNKRMDDKDEIWLKSLAKQLANTINKIGDQFDIFSGHENN